ncbi:MAG: response regulator transcription factor [Microbacterium sp.]
MANAVGAASPLLNDADEDVLAGELGYLLRVCGCALFELTAREIDVLEQVAAGKSTRAAAASLFVSQQAITYHVGNLLAKFQCTSRTGLVSRAFVLGILDRTWPPRVAHGSDRSQAHASRSCGGRLKDGRSTRTHMVW